MSNKVDNPGTSIAESFKHIDLNTGIFRTRIFRVSELIDMLKSKKLQFVGGRPFKRWNNSHKSRFIESLLLGLPSDPIIIDGADYPWYVADGAEAISTIFDYINERFRLDSVNFNLGPYDKATFDDLPLMMQSRLLNLQITATIITPDATTLHRLAVYSSALLKIGKENDLWKCAEVIFKNSILYLKEFSAQIRSDNPHLLLQIINAAIFSDCYKSGSFKDLPDIGKIRFNMFECLLLASLDSILDNVKVFVLQNYLTIGEIVRFIEATENIVSREQGKKRRIFTITFTLHILKYPKYNNHSFISQFDKAWSLYEGTGKGDLNKDYAKKASVIYNYLSK